jgi:diguanylate cyclase (GGDEF)-like protein
MSRPPNPDALDGGECAAAISPTLPLTEVTRTVTALLSDRLGIPTALVSRIDGAWRFEAEGWPSGETASDASWRTAAVRLQYGPDAVDDAGSREPRWTGIPVGGGGGRSWVLLLPGAPEEWEGTSVVSQFVPDIGALLEDAAEREHSDQWKRDAQRFHRFCRRLTRTQTEDELHGLILRTLAAQVRADVGVLAMYCEGSRKLAIVKTLGYPRELVDHLRLAPGEGVLGAVFSSGRPVLVAGGGPDYVHRRLRYRTDSYLALPLTGQTGVLGVAAFTDRRDGSAFSAYDLSALRLLADPAALALTAQKLRHSADEVTRLASIDPLTGLFNRRYFDTRLEAELQRARRNTDPLTLLMVDIDNFKAINDDHGHVVGDRLLRCVAERLRRGVRIFDVCARYGGDEFAILMPSSSIDTAVLVAERIRTSVDGHCAHGTAGVTVSIGVAHSDGRERELLSIADRALLEAKAMGKNRIRVHRIAEPE